MSARLTLLLAGLLQAGMTCAETVGDVIHSGEALPQPTVASGSIDKARSAYASFLAGSADSPHRATAMRRLADLELEAALRSLEAGETASFEYPTRLYREFLDQYPDDNAVDHVLYQLSRALDNAGETAAALQYLEKLTVEFGDSPLAAEALFRQAEMSFSRRDYRAAAKSYEAVYTLHSDTRFEINARYKHGWALFKLERYAGAVARFAGLVDHVLDGSSPVPAQIEAFTPGQREVFGDALHASSIALTEIGGAAHLDVTLATEPLPAWAYLFYERLGEHYMAEERFAEAAESFGAFARRLPTHAQAPILQARVIETYEAAGFAGRVIQARADFVQAYGFDAPYWQGRLPADHPEIATQLSYHLQALTEHYHAQAQSTGEVAAVDAAVHWYRSWLGYFPEESGTAARNFLLAELLFDAGRFDQAAMEYERTAYEYPSHDQAVEAGYAALLARDSAYAQSGSRLAAAPTRDSSAGAAASRDTDDLAILRQLALDSRLRFANGWPDDARAPLVLLSAAEELYALGQPVDAVAVADRALQRTGVLTPAQQRTAWVVQGHAQFDLASYPQSEHAYRSALAVAPSQDTLTTDLQERLAASIYEQGRVARDSGDLASASGHFLRIAELAFDSPVHPVALYDASAALVDLQQWDRAALALEDFRQRYPRHKLATGIAEQLTGVYLQGDRPLAAAAELSSIADSSDAETATLARWQAAQLYADNGDQSAHLQMLETLANDPVTPFADAMRAREQLLGIRLAHKDIDAVRYWRENIIVADANAGAQRSDYSRTLAARSALALAEPLGERFATLKLTLPLEASLPAKKNSLQTALAAFERVAGYGIDETSTAATYRIAELYRQFGVALMESERPAELDELALEEYEFLLEEQAFPFEEQAIELHEINTTRAAALVYNEWIARSYRQLAQLMPGRYDRGEQRESLVSQYD